MSHALFNKNTKSIKIVNAYYYFVCAHVIILGFYGIIIHTTWDIDSKYQIQIVKMQFTFTDTILSVSIAICTGLGWCYKSQKYLISKPRYFRMC